jgi:hypothetical protein
VLRADAVRGKNVAKKLYRGAKEFSFLGFKDYHLLPEDVEHDFEVLLMLFHGGRVDEDIVDEELDEGQVSQHTIHPALVRCRAVRKSHG